MKKEYAHISRKLKTKMFPFYFIMLDVFIFRLALLMLLLFVINYVIFLLHNFCNNFSPFFFFLKCNIETKDLQLVDDTQFGTKGKGRRI